MPGSNGGNIVVPVGVELELKNVQEIIANLQKAMSNVKPDIKGYSSITQELTKAERKAEGLASKLKQGFTTQSGIQNFTKGFEELIALVDTVNSKVGKIGFDNLILTPDQTAQMAAFAQQVQAAKDAYNAIETDKIQEAVKNSQELKANFDSLKINADTTTLDNAIKTIKDKVADLQKDIDSSERKAVNKETQVARRQAEMDQLAALKKSLKNGTLTQDFSQYFDKNGNFKSNGKQAFIRLLEQLGLDDATVDKVKNIAGSKIKEIQDEIDKAIDVATKKKNRSRIDAQNAANDARADIAKFTKDKASFESSAKDLETIKNSQEIVDAEQQKQEAYRKTAEEQQKYQDQATKNAKGDIGADAANKLAEALQKVRDSGGVVAGALAELDQRTRNVDAIKRSISMWMGFNQVVRLTKTTIRNIISDIRELDKVMTQIAVVTKMTQSDLWAQMSTYQQMAKTYGVATSGVYQVSQIYYQQGLQTADVMALTNETLKMAKIAGLDYSKAADYMTVAIRGFKMEMTDAQNVVDVYSNLAAKSAVSTTELATAMSKTASSAAAVGSSFENTSAMIAMMVETTRESAENIGSALKSIISRYGEMKSDPAKLIDSEGEALSLNKVDKALQSIGISLQDAQGQFRDFDEVILELSSKWDTLDKNSQRYIATIMAGNRQQSRFLALVSDYDRLSELYDEAANSEDAALAQTLKTMDSLETKIQNVKNAFQGFYANLGLEEVFKGALDVITKVINRLNSMPKLFGKIPVAAIGMVSNIVKVIKSLGLALIAQMSATWTQIKNIISNNIAEGGKDGANRADAYIKNKLGRQGAVNTKTKVGYAAGLALSTAGAGVSTLALTKSDAQVKERGGLQFLGSALSGVGSAISTGALLGGGVPGAIAGAISGITAALPGLISGISDLTHIEELELKASREEAQELKDKATLVKSEAKDLENTVDKLERLSEARFESNEAYQEWLDYINQIANNYPQLISMYDSEGNAVIEMSAAYDLLAASRGKATEAALEAQKAQLRVEQREIRQMANIANSSVAVEKAGDERGKGLRNVGSMFKDLSDDKYTVSFTSGTASHFTKDQIDKLFSQLVMDNTPTNGVSTKYRNAKVNADAINEVLQWDESDFGDSLEELKNAKTAMADLFYEQFIGPLAKNGLLKTLGIDSENDIQIDISGMTEEEIVDYYLNLMNQINERLQSDKELEQQLQELEQKKAEVDNAFQKWANDRQGIVTELDEKIMKDFSGDSLMKSIAEKNIDYVGPNGELNAAGQAFMDSLYEFYSKIDADTYKQVTAVLAHPEEYASKDELKNALTDLLGSEDLWNNYLTTSAKDTKSYIEDLWKQNKNRQTTFRRNIKGSIEKTDNDIIKQAAENLLTVGNGSKVGENGTEIVSAYLNTINKQWTDLVSKQKNEAVATQNAEFLSDTYINIGQLSEEVNSAMAGILTSAELDTREGIQNAIDQIQAYRAENEISKADQSLLDQILANLIKHKEELLLNLNTEIQSYVDSLSDAAKTINENYSKNTSGFSELKDANEILQKINTRKTKSGEELLNFNDVFKFDETLGKYVFTIKGLQEANNQVITDLDDQYQDVTDQLTKTTDIITNLIEEQNVNPQDKTSLLETLKARSTSAWRTEEEKAIYGKLVQELEQTDLTVDQFLANKNKELEQEGININQAKVALDNMTKTAQQRTAFKTINFTNIANGSQSFEESKQSLLNYYATTINEDLPQFIQDAQMKLAEVASQVMFNQLKLGGQAGLNAYRLLAALTGQETDKNTENEIYNERVKAINSLHNKIQSSMGQERIQLDDAERAVLQVDDRDIGAKELADKYHELIQEVRNGVRNGQEDLETANAIIMDETLADELKLDKQKSTFASIGSAAINYDSIRNLANTFGVLEDLTDFDITKLAGTTEIDGERFITNVEDFVNGFSDLIAGGLTDIQKEALISGLSLKNQSKITDAAIQAENSIIESIANEINNIKSAGIDKKVNLTYLQNKLGDDNLSKIFGDAYQNGILTVTSAVKANMYNSLKILRSDLKAKGYDTSELTDTLIQYINSSISNLTEYVGEFTVSDETAQVLAANSFIFKNQLQTTGKIAIQSVEQFARAANVVYTEVANQYNRGLTNLTQLNSTYANVVKSNLAKQSAGFNLLSTASSFDLSSLQNFLNIYDKKLSDYVTKMGDLTTKGAEIGLSSLGNGNYQIADWHKFISQLQITANELSTEYIDAYVSWLQSEANTAPNAKEALMTSLISDMEKLSYAQIGQIAKTFKMTVDDVLLLVENNGDNTFNGAALLNTLQFDKNNEDFARALSTQMQTVSSNMTSAMIAFVEAGADGKRTRFDYDNLRQSVSDYEKAMRALGEDVSINTNKIFSSLVQGGEKAVTAAQEIAKFSNQELSAQDIETLYRGSVSKLVSAIDTVAAKSGEIVDTTTARLIAENGGKVNQLGTTGQYVVESAANLYEAYNDLLLKLKATGEATLADINKVAALALENRDGEQQVIDALGDAAGMTFTRFGEILADAGIELTEDMINNLEAANIIKLMGGNKMQIIDFNAFADLMHWDANSEEYVSAFKAYNDSLIDLNRKAEQNILDEVKNVASAKGGDWINLTQLMSKLQEGFRYEGSEKISLGDSLEASIQKFGAKIEDGILKLSDSVNIPAIMQEIAQAAAESGGLLSSELAELADAVADTIKGYADLISGAISGSLSNVQAEQLQDWASTNGIGKLNFTETADGLKVATDQAFELVAALRQVDSMQSKLTFDNLVDSLSADKGGRFENISKTTAEIAKAQREIAENSQKIDFLQKDDEKTNAKDIQALKDKNAKLREQIGLYREIQQRQSIDSAQYNFMDRDIPEVMQGPINYWNSVGQAYSALNETAQTGKMDIQDFTNIVNEMSNLAATSGEKLMFFGQEIDGSAENAAALIQKGYSALSNVDGKGVKVDLSKMGIDFAAGADNAKNNFDAGIKSLAESQVAMLDAAIKVLEVVVAMEQLKDLNVDGGDNKLDLSDLFKIDIETGEATDWDEDFHKASENILALAEDDDDLKQALEQVKVNNTSLGDMFVAAKDSYTIVNGQIEELGMSVDKYQTVMNAFYQAMLNGDYNLDTIQDSVWEILNKTLPDGTTIEIGNRTVVISGGTSLQIDWENEDTQNALEVFEGDLEDDLEDKKEALKEAFIAYSNKTATHEQITAILTYKGKIKINTETGEVIIGDNTYPDLDSDEALLAIAEEALKDAGADKINDDGKIEGKGDEKVVTMSSIMKVGEQEIKVEYNNGKITYTDGVNSADSWEELIHKQFLAEQKLANENGSSGWSSEEEFVKARYGLKVAAELFTDNVSIKNEENFKNRTQEQVNKLASALVSGDKDEVVEAAKTIGIDVDVKGELTAEQRQQIAEIAGITSETKALNVALSVTGDKIDLVERLLKGEDLIAKIDADIDAATSKINEIIEAIEEEKKKPVDLDTKKANSTLSTLENNIKSSIDKYVDIKANITEQYTEALREILKPQDKIINIKSKGTVNTTPPEKTGNVSLATGRARAAGQTLMGELGPELVVSHGRYFVVGQNGPEMVNLADDAIVFNHLQTEQLLKHGKTSSRATPITNERKATSLATGNVGPAMASPSDALATLKQLRSMWQSLLNASLRDLGAMGGSGGGGGGGGGNNDTTGVVKDVERWYNWLKKIEETQNKINILTKKYTLLEKQNATETQKLANLTKQYENLADNKSTKEQLAAEQTKYRKNLLKQVNGKEKGSYNLLSAFYSANEKTGKLTLKDDKAFEKYIGKKKAKKLKNEGIKLARREYYTEEEAEEYNKNNQVKVKAGDYKGNAKNKDTIKAKNGLELIDQLQKKDNYGNLIYSAEDQYNILANLLGKKNFEKYVAKDTSGKELESWEEKVEYFFTQIESGKGEIEDLNQSIQEQTESALDDAIAMQEINEQIRELYTPVAGITEGFEEWYNELKKIESITNNLTKLSKQLDILENDRIANGKEIYENLAAQAKQNTERIKQEEDLIEKRKAERNNLLEGELNFLKPFVDLNTEKGIATFKEQSLEEILGKDFNSEITYKKSGVAKTNKQGYFVDTKGRYYDDKGILRNKNGKKAKKGVEFGEQATTKEKNATFNFSDYKDLNALIKELKSKNENGSFKYDSSETFQILSQVPEFAEMMKYDEQGNKVYQDLASISKEEKQEAARLVVSKLQKGIDSLNDNEKAIFDGEMNIYDAQAANLDLQRKINDTKESLENQVLQAIIDLRQKVIDEVKKNRDAYSKAANKMIDGLNNQLKKEQDMYQKNENDKEIETLQRQISVLQRSSGSASEIQKLQNDLADKRKDAYFKERQSEIDIIKEASDNQLEKMDQQIEIMTATLEYERNNGLLWSRVAEIIKNGQAASVVLATSLSESPDAKNNLALETNEKNEIVNAAHEDSSVAQKVIDAINALPNEITLNDKGKVEEARKAYDALTDMQKAYISDDVNKKLTNAESSISAAQKAAEAAAAAAAAAQKAAEAAAAAAAKANQEAANSVVTAIETLRATEVNKRKDQDIKQVRANYNNLTDEQKKLVSEKALEKLEVIESEKTTRDQQIASVVSQKIGGLYRKYGYDNTKSNSITEAKKAYDKLTDDQKALISEEDKLKLQDTLEVRTVAEDFNKKVTSLQNKYINSGQAQAGTIRKKYKGDTNTINKEIKRLEGDIHKKYQEGYKKLFDTYIEDLKKLNVKTLPKAQDWVPHFSQGGIIDFTGLAMVHGSKTKPETIFNDEQTKMLKEILFKNNSLISNLQAAVFNPNSEAMNSYNNSYNENDSSIQINEVNMSVNVPSISNDYDARRAGQMALDEMVRVARKSGNRAVSRR